MVSCEFYKHFQQLFLQHLRNSVVVYASPSPLCFSLLSCWPCVWLLPPPTGMAAHRATPKSKRENRQNIAIDVVGLLGDRELRVGYTR